MQLIETIDGRRVHTLAGHMLATLFAAYSSTLPLAHTAGLDCPRCMLEEDLDAALAGYHGCTAARITIPSLDLTLDPEAL